MTYEQFLNSKHIKSVPTGLKEVRPMAAKMFDYQQDITSWALRRGRAGIFEDCGLGKTIQELEWAKQVAESENGKVLLIAPLMVSAQHVIEAEKFGYDVRFCRTNGEVENGINITNYEKLHKFDLSQFVGVALDESSILKSFDSKTRITVTEAFRETPYRSAWTATPAPNDFMELGNHAEFLGVMNRSEMLATFFVHDGGDTSKWRLKGHAKDEFWKWVCSWAVYLRKPSDLGYSDDGFALPELRVHEIVVESEQNLNGYLFPMPAATLSERRDARKGSRVERVEAACDLINKSNEQWVAWCDLNSESELLHKAIKDSVEIKGADSDDHKLDAVKGFLSGKYRVLVSKPSMFGHGLNFQHCHNTAFVGLSDSWEMYYQAVRRFWRFGQKHPVNVHIITARNEGAVVANIKRKENDAMHLAQGMVQHMSQISRKEIKGLVRESEIYQPNQTMTLPAWI